MFLAIAQAADVMHHIPSLVVIHGASERRHRSAVQPGNQIAEHIAITLPAFEAAAAREIEGRDREPFTVGESRSRRTITASVFAVTGPAIHALKELRSPLNALWRIGWLGRNLNRRSGLFFLKR